MGDYTVRTRAWLEGQFTRVDAHGRRQFHQPLFDVSDARFEGKHLAGLARLAHVLRALDGLAVESVLDVGAAEGLFAHAIRGLTGAEVVAGDASFEAALVARRELSLPALVLDAARLPFRDGAFDAVICCEVLEHVEHPVETLLELLRVARATVIVTTEECLADRAEIARRLFERSGYPHEERNLFHPDDLRAVLGARVELAAQFTGPYPAAPRGEGEARRFLLERARPRGMPAEGRGVVAVAVLDGGRRRARTRSDEELVGRVLSARREVAPPAGEQLSAALLGRLSCPLTRAPLELAGGALAAAGGALAAAGGARYEIRSGVPVMLGARAADPTAEETRARLAAARGAGEQRVADALLLRARLRLPAASDRRAFDFARPAHRRGWHPSADLARDEQQGGARSGEGAGGVALQGRVIGADPGWTSPRLAARDVAAVRVRLSAALEGGGPAPAVGQLFWLCEDGVAFSERDSARFPLLADGRPREVLVRVPVDPGRCIAWLRVDPCEAVGRVALHALELLSAEDLAARPVVLAWDFRVPAERAEWIATGPAQAIETGFALSAGGALTGRGPEIPARELSGLELELSCSATPGGGAPALLLEWLGARDREPDPARAAVLGLCAGEGHLHATLALESWRDAERVPWVRLSPAGDTARIELSSLAWRLARPPAPRG